MVEMEPEQESASVSDSGSEPKAKVRQNRSAKRNAKKPKSISDQRYTIAIGGECLTGMIVFVSQLKRNKEGRMESGLRYERRNL